MSSTEIDSASDQARLKREAEFHDRIFAEAERASADRFYSITGASKTSFREYLKTHCRARVLEYGCGPHTHANLLNPRGATVVGIDISPVALAMRRKLAEKGGWNVSASVMNAEALGFADGSFDLVCGSGILHHLDIDACLAEISRVLSPGGSAIFVEPLGHNPLINLYRRRTPQMRSVDEHPLLASDFEKARRHFERVELRFFHLSSLAAAPFHKLPGFRAAVRALDAVDRTIFRLLPWMRKHAWAVVMIMAAPKRA